MKTKIFSIFHGKNLWMASMIPLDDNGALIFFPWKCLWKTFNFVYFFHEIPGPFLDNFAWNSSVFHRGWGYRQKMERPIIKGGSFIIVKLGQCHWPYYQPFSFKIVKQEDNVLGSVRASVCLMAEQFDLHHLEMQDKTDTRQTRDSDNGKRQAGSSFEEAHFEAQLCVITWVPMFIKFMQSVNSLSGLVQRTCAEPVSTNYF